MMVVSPGPSAGGNVWMAPLISMVAERSGRRVLTQDPADRLAGAVLHGAGDGERGEHDGQVRFDRCRCRLFIRAGQVACRYS
jgi:hypothetical protein